MASIRLVLHVRNEGPTALHPQQGDIKRAEAGSWEPPEGLKRNELIVQVDDYNDSYGDVSVLATPEYGVGQDGDPVMERYRAYAVDFVAKLDPAVLSDVLDSSVVVEPIIDVFSQSDIFQKK